MNAGSPDKFHGALAIFTDWAGTQRTEGPLPFEQLCAAHPELAEPLRRLHSVYQLGGAAARTRSFHQSLCEQFGDETEVMVKLEDGGADEGAFGLPPSAGPARELPEG